MSLSEQLAELNSRLPELEWKISELNTAISIHHLPKGLFRTRFDLTGAGFVQEIQADITALSQEKNERSAQFLAERIKQKINVLVALCQMDRKKNKTKVPVSFGIKSLTTRQQWIQSLEQEINTLKLQQEAMATTLKQKVFHGNTHSLLLLKAELGEVERRLTLARETLNQAVLS